MGVGRVRSARGPLVLSSLRTPRPFEGGAASPLPAASPPCADCVGTWLGKGLSQPAGSAGETFPLVLKQKTLWEHPVGRSCCGAGTSSQAHLCSSPAFWGRGGGVGARFQGRCAVAAALSQTLWGSAACAQDGAVGFVCLHLSCGWGPAGLWGSWRCWQSAGSWGSARAPRAAASPGLALS